MELKKKFAMTIYRLRTQDPNLKIKRKDIAMEVGITERYYYDLEMGKKMPTLDKVEAFAKAFNMTLSEFCKLIEEQG